MSSQRQALRDAVRKALSGLDMVIAWTKGYDGLHHTPLFITSEDEVDKIEWDPRCYTNLAGYLPGFKGRKVGIVAKGCDVRSIVALIQEGMVDRSDVTIFGLHCPGVVDPGRVREVLNSSLDTKFDRCMVRDGHLVLESPSGEKTIPLDHALMDKCYRCAGTDVEHCDHFLGERGRPPTAEPSQPGMLEQLESMEPEERFRFWERTMESCIRCYACRNACPLCVCRDHCAAQSRDPKWVDQTDHPREKLMFQIMHALHTAGRCTECGECERACPMNLPVMTMKQALNRQIKDLFDYQAGTDPDAIPPLLRFREEEARIKEKQW